MTKGATVRIRDGEEEVEEEEEFSKRGLCVLFSNLHHLFPLHNPSPPELYIAAPLMRHGCACRGEGVGRGQGVWERQELTRG